MSSVLRQFDSDQAILLLYAAGELDADARAAVEARLAAEPQLRLELEKLQALDATVRGMIAAGDSAEQGPTLRHAQAAAREVARNVRRANLQPARAEARRSGWRMPAWGCSAAAAAVLLIACLAWWGRTDSPVTPPAPVGTNTPVAQAPKPTATGDPFADEDNSAATGVDGKLSDAEKQLALVNGSAADPADLFGPGW